jgi:hypothetical protein
MGTDHRTVALKVRLESPTYDRPKRPWVRETNLLHVLAQERDARNQGE